MTQPNYVEATVYAQIKPRLSYIVGTPIIVEAVDPR